MQWDAEGSFTDAAEPWLPFAHDHATVNVAAQREDPGSLLLALPRACSRLRRSEPDLVDGAYRTLEAGGDVLRFARGDSLEVRIDFARRRRRRSSSDGREVRATDRMSVRRVKIR